MQSNSNKTEPSTPFEYPEEQPQTVVKDENIRRLLDFVTFYVLTDRHPRLALIALCYASGYDVGALFNTDNTVRSIAKANGIVHVQLAKKITQVQKHFGLQKK